MSQFKLIGAKDALSMIENEQAKLVDIRDPQAFAQSHAPGAIHLTNDTVVNFMNETEFDETVLVMCYHGVSSQSAAEYLANQGYEDVYSVEGGFAAWERANYPVES